MKYFILCISFIFSTQLSAQSYNGPESVDYHPLTDTYFISNSSAGEILTLNSDGILSIFASNMSGPHGLEVVGDTLFVCSGSNLRAFDINTGNQVVNYPVGAQFLNGITHKGKDVYVTDFSAKKIYRYNIASGNHNLYTSVNRTPNGILYDDINDRLMVVCWGNNAPIYEINLSDSVSNIVINTKLGNIDGIGMNDCGEFFISAWSTNSIHKFSSDFSFNENIQSGMSSPADVYYNRFNDILAVPNSSSNTVDFIQLENCNPVSILKNELSHLLVFPNPTKSGNSLTFSEKVYSAVWINQMGQTVSEHSLSGTYNISVPSLKSGVYFLTINAQNTYKIFITK
tara:strand:- start:2279 stop:3304 length:1026 start_codon:yes stop_codon:yes gene_type:complete